MLGPGDPPAGGASSAHVLPREPATHAQPEGALRVAALGRGAPAGLDSAAGREPAVPDPRAPAPGPANSGIKVTYPCFHLRIER